MPLVTISCNPTYPAEMIADWDDAKWPPMPFYDVVGKLGAIVAGLPADVVRKTATNSCVQASRRADGTAVVELQGVTINCQAPARTVEHGGGGVMIRLTGRMSAPSPARGTPFPRRP